jgi:hypothetical protein
MLRAWALGLLVVLPWYLRQSLNIAAGTQFSNLSYLAAMTAQGRGHAAVVAAAFARLYGAPGGFARPMCWFLAGSILLSIADSVARKVLLWVLCPILFLWALFFSYEVRTASLAFPFLAFCSAAGVGVLLRSLGLFSRRPVDWVAAGSSRMPFLGAACLLLVSLSLYSAPIRDRVSLGWHRYLMGEVARWWAIPLGGSALTLAALGLTAKRNWAMTVNWCLLAGFGAWLWLATTMDRGSDIVERQIALQKDIGDADLNRKLYDFLAREGLHGKVATDYLAFGRLPVLKQYYRHQYFPDHTSAEYLAEAAKGSGVCYILIPERELEGTARKALAEGLYRVVLADGLYRFIQTCGGAHGSN